MPSTLSCTAYKASDLLPRVYFSRWFLQRLAVQPDFAAHVLFTDECIFSREGIFNAHNWTYTNSHAIHPHSYQRSFSINVWTGIIPDHLSIASAKAPGRWCEARILA
ncbi:uncharacterized protein TNCV_3625211 [Trichonephila clavipes]|nr:uncharacterized protein TNCV_3625211 [Trichonephila clavipes]